MPRFEYARVFSGIDMLNREFYQFENFKSESLEEILNDMGNCEWELVGEVDGQIIMKRPVKNKSSD